MARSTATEWVSKAGWVTAVSLSSSAGAFPAELGEREPEDLVGLGKDRPGGSIRRSQISAHADLLRSLTGEEEGGVVRIGRHDRGQEGRTQGSIALRIPLGDSASHPLGG